MTDTTQDVEDDPPEWPFPHTPPEVCWSLPEADRMGLEKIIRDLIDKTNSKH